MQKNGAIATAGACGHCDLPTVRGTDVFMTSEQTVVWNGDLLTPTRPALL